HLTQLMVLDIEHNKFRGHLSSFLENLSKLRTLIVGWNEFITGTFSWICKLSGIYVLDIDLVNIDSQIPLCFANLTQLSRFSLFHSYLSGPIPSWIMNLTNLAYMDLPGCNLHGAIPNSLFKLENLEVFNVAYNLLEGELELHKFQSFKMHSMQPFLEFNYNNVNSFPSWIWGITNLQVLIVSNRSLVGKLSLLIFNLRSFVHLDLLFNNLVGMVLSCFGSSSQSLKVLVLKENKFIGLIPQTYMITSDMRMMDLSNNYLQGQLPRESVNCRMLEFSGSLPSETIHNWKTMKASNESQLQYEGDLFYLLLGSLHWIIDQGYYSLKMFNKGIIMVYRDLQDLYYLIAIDLSSNKLCGETPHVMGELTGLVLLNLFNNMLSGSIPSSLGNPSNLEALDLSLNSLSGKIPQQLAELIFLSLLRISHQFSTFQGTSFEGNQGLCGNQLVKKSSDEDDQDSGFFGEFDWKVAVIGYGGELLAGVALGSTFSHEIFAWLKRVSSVVW
ncbi:Receptor-like protein 9DC3, partial [Glycine soja]